LIAGLSPLKRRAQASAQLRECYAGTRERAAGFESVAFKRAQIPNGFHQE
jgi:hypothetical protein